MRTARGSKRAASNQGWQADYQGLLANLAAYSWQLQPGNPQRTFFNEINKILDKADNLGKIVIRTVLP